jgi:hypothetical protein
LPDDPQPSSPKNGSPDSAQLSEPL